MQILADYLKEELEKKLKPKLAIHKGNSKMVSSMDNVPVVFNIVVIT